MLGAWPAAEPIHEPALDLSLLCIGEATPEVLPHDGFCRLVQVKGHLHPRHHLRVPDRLFHVLILPGRGARGVGSGGVGRKWYGGSRLGRIWLWLNLVDPWLVVLLSWEMDATFGRETLMTHRYRISLFLALIAYLLPAGARAEWQQKVDTSVLQAASA